MKSRKANTRTIAVIAIMSALAFVFMLLEFSLPFVPSFLKFDFSDLPAFLVSFSISPLAGVVVEFAKNLLHLPFTSTGSIGEIANFIIGVAYVVPAGLVYKYHRTKRSALMGAIVGTVSASLVSVPVNYCITYPVYLRIFNISRDEIVKIYSALFPWVDSLINALVTINLPFTLFKGIVNVIITFLIYKPLSPILKEKKNKKLYK